MLTQPPADPRVGWERSRPLPPTPRPRRGRLAAPWTGILRRDERAGVTRPSLPPSGVLRPHPFPAAECPLVVTLEVFEDSEEETGIRWTPRSRARGQGLPEDEDLLPTWALRGTGAGSAWGGRLREGRSEQCFCPRGAAGAARPAGRSHQASRPRTTSGPSSRRVPLPLTPCCPPSRGRPLRRGWGALCPSCQARRLGHASPLRGCQAFPRPTLPRAQPRSRPRPRDRGPEPGGGARLGGRDIENFHREQIWSLSPFLAPGSSNSWNVLSAESGKCVFCYVNEVTWAGHQENQSGD